MEPSSERPYNVSVAPPEVGEFAPDIDVTVGGSVALRSNKCDYVTISYLPLETTKANCPKMILSGSNVSAS
jgi:hypothetical protein